MLPSLSVGGLVVCAEPRAPPALARPRKPPRHPPPLDGLPLLRFTGVPVSEPSSPPTSGVPQSAGCGRGGRPGRLFGGRDCEVCGVGGFEGSSGISESAAFVPASSSTSSSSGAGVAFWESSGLSSISSSSCSSGFGVSGVRLSLQRWSRSANDYDMGSYEGLTSRSKAATRRPAPSWRHVCACSQGSKSEGGCSDVSAIILMDTMAGFVTRVVKREACAGLGRFWPGSLHCQADPSRAATREDGSGCRLLARSYNSSIYMYSWNMEEFQTNRRRLRIASSLALPGLCLAERLPRGGELVCTDGWPCGEGEKVADCL